METMEKMFDVHLHNGMYTLKFRLLDHMIKAIEIRGRM